MREQRLHTFLGNHIFFTWRLSWCLTHFCNLLFLSSLFHHTASHFHNCCVFVRLLVSKKKNVVRYHEVYFSLGTIMALPFKLHTAGVHGWSNTKKLVIVWWKKSFTSFFQRFIMIFTWKIWENPASGPSVKIFFIRLLLPRVNFYAHATDCITGNVRCQRTHTRGKNTGCLWLWCIDFLYSCQTVAFLLCPEQDKER